MRKRNSVKQLNRVASHRKAMFKNMATSLFDHEQIVTTRAKAKAIRPYVERLITRAKKNLEDNLGEPQKLHNKREILRSIQDRDIAAKLFDDIAVRFKDRNGGYTRIIHLQERASDSAQMSIIELVEKKEKKKREKVKTKAASAGDTSKGSDTTQASAKKDKKSGVPEREKKWYHRFSRKKAEDQEEES